MSRYSGKCDCCNHFEHDSEEKMLEQIRNTDIYVGDCAVPLRIDTIKDLVPFYPYLIGLGFWNKNGERNTVRLSNESFVDREEREHLEWMEKDVLKYFNKCKRKKEEVDNEYFLNKQYESNKELKTTILKRVMAGDKEPTKGLHLPMQEFYRKELFKEMVRVGWDEATARRWCFGWRLEDYQGGI